MVFAFLFLTWTANATSEKRDNQQQPIGLFQGTTTEPPTKQTRLFQSSSGGLLPPGGGTGTPDDGQETGSPVGDALPILIGLALIYGVYISLKRRKRGVKPYS